ncbi:hypothetical protein HUT16_32870 [Kitasatospora sp. NA04385]|uniref:hypothetical protein n=1 Tax=Kitasatospora sp. NA04385 TaxID=2742135 RepID=UPI0015924B25|nr:hypothetical protein [Kitasatospora sp. NA04385]QKW23242.1 hypothetical protein HUT16_32870 [Kitasatospora sp. NA04385]
MPLTRPLAVPLGAALALALPLAAPWPAGAANTDPVAVANATFSSPTVQSGNWTAGVDGWTGPTGVASVDRAAHPKGLQAATLGWNGVAVSLSTRLRGVRAGANVTLVWDDNPDSCVTSGAGPRTYTVTVAGTANPVGDFTTNAPAAKADWYTGRTYSFTAAEDSPHVTFTNTATSNPGCGELITNVQAFQTPPEPTSPGSSDPCAGEGAGSPACTTDAGNKQQIENCPATSRDCLAGVAGKGEQENAGIAQQTQALDEFTNTPRDQDPNTAADALCQVSNAHTGNLQPGDTVIPPGTWWYC